MWPELSDTPVGLTDSRVGLHEASQSAFKKDALLDRELNKSPLPTSSPTLGQTVSNVSETVQEELTPPPQTVLKGKSKSEPLKQKKDIGES